MHAYIHKYIYTYMVHTYMHTYIIHTYNLLISIFYKKVTNRTVLVRLGYISKLIMYKNRTVFCEYSESIEVDIVH